MMNQFFGFTEGTTVSSSEIFKICKNTENLSTDTKALDKSVAKEINYSDNEVKTRTPENNGNWEGQRGNSKWIPDSDYTPQEKSKNPDKPYSNPDNLSWGEILEKYDIDGIEFKDGFPVFDEVSKGNVDIDGFETGGTEAKDHNFKKADIAMAEKRGCTPKEVAEWRKENNYTWHECENKSTMQKVPNEVHANITHDGGRSQYER